MDNIFLLKLLLSFLVGSIWVSALTILAEKTNPKIGGVFGGMPSTVLLGLLFIGWTQSPGAAVQAATIVPLSIGLLGFFILFYILLVKRNFVLSILIPLIIWFLTNLWLVYINFNNFELSLLIGSLSVLISFLIIEYVLKINTKIGKKYIFSIRDVLFRAFVSGSIIALTVLSAKIGGPLIGGVFASFPAVYVSTMIITYRSQGSAYSSGIMKILMISGIINVTVYSSAVKYLYPTMGLIYGTILAFLISLFSAYIVYSLVKKIR